VSPRIFPAGVHRFSEHVSTGRALNWVTRGQPLHPGLVALPGSGDVLETPGAALGVPLSSLTGATGGRVVERGSDVTASFLHLDRRPAKNADQHIAKSFGSVAPSVFGSAHGFNHGASHAREVVNPCQGLGNVCRA